MGDSSQSPSYSEYSNSTQTSASVTMIESPEYPSPSDYTDSDYSFRNFDGDYEPLTPAGEEDRELIPFFVNIHALGSSNMVENDDEIQIIE